MKVSFKVLQDRLNAQSKKEVVVKLHEIRPNVIKFKKQTKSDEKYTEVSNSISKNDILNEYKIKKIPLSLFK
jgi:hypothetical protein